VIIQQRPNLIYVFADQLRYQSCGYAGDKRARTPNIDRLATQSVNLCNAVSSHPVCAPYRATLFTGKYSSSTGMAINELRISPNHECFGHVLHRNDYDTAYIGKWHLWANQLGHHEDVRNSFTPRGPDRLGFDGYWAAYNFNHQNYQTYYHTESAEKIPAEGFAPDSQTTLAIEQIQRLSRGSKPFTMFLSLGTPHDPWGADNVLPEYLAMFKDVDFPLPPNYSDKWASFKPGEREKLADWMRGYYAMTANLDWNIGRIVEAIGKAGLSENTIFVFTSDHGEMFGAQGRRAKNIFYEESVRIPFLVRWPGHIAPGSISDVCFNSPDVMPTLLRLMDLPVPKAVEGDDLSQCLLGKAGPQSEAALLQGMGCTAAWSDGYEWRGLRDKQYTYAVYLRDRSELLFDNVVDPYQTKNLAANASHAGKLEHFRKMLKSRMERINDTFEACTWYRDHWTRDRIIVRSATMQD
jgi:arylsulfatase A-like enzyme